MEHEIFIKFNKSFCKKCFNNGDIVEVFLYDCCNCGYEYHSKNYLGDITEFVCPECKKEYLQVIETQILSIIEYNNAQNLGTELICSKEYIEKVNYLKEFDRGYRKMLSEDTLLNDFLQ